MSFRGLFVGGKLSKSVKTLGARTLSHLFRLNYLFSKHLEFVSKQHISQNRFGYGDMEQNISR